MAVVIRLQGLPIVAGTMDIRHFFSGLTIPDGGVHIVGGELGEAFIVFSTDEDARLGMMRGGGTIKGSKVSLLLSSKTEMQNMIELSRRRFETGNVDMPPVGSSRPGPTSNTGITARGSLPTTMPNLNTPTMVTTTSSLHESIGNKNVPTFSAASMGSTSSSLNPTFTSPGFSMGSTITSTMPPLNTINSVPPLPPLPPLPTMPSLPPMPSVPPIGILPPVPPLPPIAPLAPIPPMPPIPPLPSLPPMPINAGSTLPLGSSGPSGMNGSGSALGISNSISSMYMGPIGSLNPLHPMNSHSSINKGPPPINSNDVYVHIYGMPYTAMESDVREFFHGLRIEAVHMMKDHLGRNNRDAMVKFYSSSDTFEALKRHGKMMMGQRFANVFPATERQWLNATVGFSTPKSMAPPPSIGHYGQNLPPFHTSRSESPSKRERSRSRSPHEKEFCVYLKGLPYEAENKHIMEFFNKLELIEDSIYIAYGPSGRATGEGFVEFKTPTDYQAALCRHKQYMGNRFIQVHPITKKAMLEKLENIQKRAHNFVPNEQKREVTVKTEEVSGSPKICGHIWNIPYNVTKSDVFQFLEGIGLAENGVQILVDSNGQGLGQALVQFLNEEEAQKAERLHRKKLNGRNAFLQLITLEQKQEMETNPPFQTKSQKNPNQGSLDPTFLPCVGGDSIFSPSVSSGNLNGPVPPFNPVSSFSGSTSLFGQGPSPGSGVSVSISDGPTGGPVFGSSTVSSFPGAGVEPRVGSGPLSTKSPTVVKVQNLPFKVSVDEILDFFYGYRVIPDSVCLQFNEQGMPTGEAMVAFESCNEAMSAVVDLSDRPMGSRKVKLVLG
ncbi:RNA-binding protein 12 [Stegostoma tigrinum]|uniref:RNA-binding protein 12 n=1 Tax=Stegostoma tigrinum TaxID=3053191 RepID=UPI00202AC340|nr:RNA-binding protein 12 [Stegostoma tigrinum]XP_059508677.1 RNA-binding protein 12 [Stegostoma tigrinum]